MSDRGVLLVSRQVIFVVRYYVILIMLLHRNIKPLV